MNVPSRRRLAVLALIVAGIGALTVPFLLRNPSTQPTSPSPTTTSGNNNNNGNSNNSNNSNNSGGATNTNGSGGTNSDSSCKGDKPHNPSARDKKETEDNGNAFGVVKNKMDTTIAMVKSMGTHNSAFHLHHDTDTDNDHAHGPHHITHDPNGQDSSCASDDEENDQD